MSHSVSTPSTGSVLMAALAAIFMGTIGVISTYSELSAEVVTFYRLFLGGMIMLVYLLIQRKAGVLRARPPWQVVLTGGLLSSFILCYVQSLSYTSMANAIMLVYLAPVVASVFCHLFLGERMSRNSFMLILLAMVGFAMMMEFQLDFSDQPQELLGLGYASLAMLAYAGFIVVNRAMPASFPVLARTWYQLMIGALCMLPALLLTPVAISFEQWGWLALAGLVPGFLAILFTVQALDRLPSNLFGTLAYCEPVAVVLFGWVLFGQSLSLLQMAGAAVIMGCGMAQAWQAVRSGQRNDTRDLQPA